MLNIPPRTKPSRSVPYCAFTIYGYSVHAGVAAVGGEGAVVAREYYSVVNMGVGNGDLVAQQIGGFDGFTDLNPFVMRMLGA
jgi:hypothetical protein